MEEGFGARLRLALDALNLSAQSLGQSLGVDKSVVRRWLAGTVTPKSHTLAAIAAELARAKPGFSALMWQAPMAEFRAFLAPAVAPPVPHAGPVATPSWPAVAEAGIRLRSLAQSAREVRLHGDVYVGLYALLRVRMTAAHIQRVEILRIWREEARLRFAMHDGTLLHEGEIIILCGHPYFVGESLSREDGLMLMLFAGLHGVRALCLDGIMTTVAMDRFLTPSSLRVIAVRIADALPDPAADAARQLAVAARVVAGNEDGSSAWLFPEEYRQAVRTDQAMARHGDHMLRTLPDRGFSLTSIEAPGRDLLLPELAAALLGPERRVTEAPRPVPQATPQPRARARRRAAPSRRRVSGSAPA